MDAKNVDEILTNGYLMEVSSYRGGTEPDLGWDIMIGVVDACMPNHSSREDKKNMCIACDVISIMTGRRVQEIISDAVMDYNPLAFYNEYLKDFAVWLDSDRFRFEFEYKDLRIVGLDYGFAVRDVSPSRRSEVFNRRD